MRSRIRARPSATGQPAADERTEGDLVRRAANWDREAFAELYRRYVRRIFNLAVRNTRDIDRLMRREDMPRANEAMTAAGYVYRHAAGIDMFLDGPGLGFQ